MAMIERRVDVGQTYCVTPSVDCTVATADGTELVNVAAGSQDYFVAPAGTVMVSDAGARLTASRNPAWLASRNPAWLASRNPAWLAELRAGLDELGVVYKLALMAASEKLVVHTDRLDDTQLEQVTALLERVLPQNIEVVRYNHNMEISWRDINKYAGFTDMRYLFAAYPNFQNDLTSDGGWIYPLTNLARVTNNIISPDVSHIDGHWRAFRNTPAKYAYFYVPNLTITENALLSGEKKNPAEVEIFAPKLTGHNRIISDSAYHIKKIKAYVPLLSHGDHAFHWNSGLRVFEGELPSLSYGYNIFNKSQLNKESALRVLNSIPSYTSGSHPLTIGIHVDHKTDDEVLAAIATAEAKGWTLTVQWNGTPTSTASTLSFGQLIYAKVAEYERPDGTTERMLDWGHYVTDPSGYETFRSLESAYEYFGLEMPQQENED